MRRAETNAMQWVTKAIFVSLRNAR